MTTVVGVFLAVLGGGALAGAVFFVIGRRVERRVVEAAGRSIRQQSERILSEARRDAEASRAEAVLAAKEEIIRAREVWEGEAQRRREELERHERRLEERETLIDRKLNALDERERELKRREQATADQDRYLKKRDEELTRVIAEHRARLEQLSGVSATEAKRNADREAKKIVALAIQRLSAETTAETTVSAVALPNDEMKGRIIGREGRNIRAFETATGVDVIIDDTP